MPADPVPAQPVFRTSEIREIERRAVAEPHPPRLMELAGRAAAEFARELAADGSPVLVLAGPGNNGGDALVAARYLRQWWYPVTVVFSGQTEKLSGDASQAMCEWRATGGAIMDALPPARRDFGLVIDGLFGIGLERKLEGAYRALVQTVNDLHRPVLALDVPSGLASDTGSVRGTAVRADHTITFIGLKPGLLTGDGPEYCGEIHVRDLGLDAASFVQASIWKIDAPLVSSWLPPRPRTSHKGHFGSVAILGGAPGMTGAALLAGRAALKLGAGRTHVGLISPVAVDTQQPELMLRPAGDVMNLAHLSCIVAGPGLGQSADACLYLDAALESTLPLVLDADALNLIAAFPELRDRLKKRRAPTLATPHPAEAARLLGTDTASVESDRLEAAGEIARSLSVHVALKGAGTICALPDGRAFLNASGNPGMASAGMGDVLSGMLGALLAQGLDAERALLLGVHLHGAAADRLVAKGIGPVGLTASEVTDEARQILNRWVYGN